MQIHELVGWGHDPEADRSLIGADDLRLAIRRAEAFLRGRKPYKLKSPLLSKERCRFQICLTDRVASVARSGEFDGLNWELAEVDLERLVAFQRRLGFSEEKGIAMPDPGDFEALLDLTIPCSASLQLGRASPYLEVALYRDRWFLRDGYHRSYCLLRHGIGRVPAVVVHARTLEQLGAIGHRFFPEVILFSARPPMVADFVNEALTVRYFRFDSASLRSGRVSPHCQLQAGK
jgi:hypothetical protein